MKPGEHNQTVAKKQEAGGENEDTKEGVLQGLAHGLCPHVLIGASGSCMPSSTFSPGFLTLSDKGEVGLHLLTHQCLAFLEPAVI